jgi:hypothetical protein
LGVSSDTQVNSYNLGTGSTLIRPVASFDWKGLSHLMCESLIFIFCAYAGTNAFYQWSCSSLDSNSYSLPDLDLANASSISLTPLNEVTIFPLPPTLNCSGTVSAVSYCYFREAESNFNEELIFTLLTLEQKGQNNFVVTNEINIHSTTTADICTTFLGRTCCDTSQLNAANQFNLPTSNFAFGIISRSEWSVSLGNLQTFGTSLSQYAVEHYSLSSVNVNVAMGSTITVGDLRTDTRLRRLKFFISK